MQAILIAGGAGTRLRPFTLNTPKPLLHLCGRPVMEYQIDMVKHAGLRRIIFALGHKAERVKQYFGDGRDWGMQFQYAFEEEPLGTGGAIRNCFPFLDGEPSVVFNADVLTDAKLSEIIDTHRKAAADVTLSLKPVEDPSRYGVVATDERGKVMAFVEKPPPGMAPSNNISAGIYVMEYGVIAAIPEGRPVSVEREIWPGLVASGAKVHSHIIGEYWLDIGTAESFLQAHWDLLEHRSQGSVGAAEVAPGLFLAEPEQWNEDVALIPPVYIGERVHFEGRCTVGPYACINEDSTIAAGVELTKFVALPGSEVKSQPAENAVVGPEVE